ncbi:hypothetical protein C2845_PM02G07530 [Panicum miliaceum]|uniref:F-box domain-containing protein n=1 Tax=Panicum miliaceum TaxID=4540 RepID=A0A3L6S539_PANMI|nr:hypothetical protein C2845_PM02G07530 [Panicum miliaceum]
MDLTELLPEDLLADVLRRLAPRWLATSRCVCRAWRATVDHCGLLRAVAGLLPRSVAGILLQLENTSSSFLSRPSAGPAVSVDLDCTFSSGDGSKVHDDSFEVRGHCNGLILLQDGAVSCVANPATRRWAHLPPRPPPPFAGPDYFYADGYLVFDPTVSPYYEVFSIPRVRRRYEPSLHGGKHAGRPGLRGGGGTSASLELSPWMDAAPDVVRRGCGASPDARGGTLEARPTQPPCTRPPHPQASLDAMRRGGPAPARRRAPRPPDAARRGHARSGAAVQARVVRGSEAGATSPRRRRRAAATVTEDKIGEE